MGIDSATTTRRSFLAAAGSVLCTARAFGALPSGRPPDVLYIMADDLGWADVHCYGRMDVPTPHIDGLAAAGMKFDHAYANSCVCTPTRVALLTGRYQNRFPLGNEEPLGKPDVGIDPGTPGLASLLKRAGYQTVLIGKWHLGMPLSVGPLKHGYDRFWGIRGGGVDYFTHAVPSDKGAQPDLWDGDVRIEQSGYLTNLLADRAVQEVQRCAASDAPFLISLHFTAPHWPWETEQDAELAAHIKNMMHFDGGSLATYQSMLRSLDNGIGRVLDALERSGRASNTIVVFTSDNGGERFAKSWPLNGMKGELLEGGIRVPLIVRWPNRVRAGSQSNELAMTMDWLPTFLDAAGAKADADAPSDGISLLPAFDGGTLPERTLFWRYKANDQAAARSGPWKYLRIGGHEYLFNVVEDPQERANRKTHEPERFEALKTAWAEWNRTMLPYTPENRSWDNRSTGSLPDRY